MQNPPWYDKVTAYMNTPDLRTFIGWHRPAIELVARKLEDLNAQEPGTFRRATVVVPTAESGRRLREYMAERAGKPILMPRITLAGQLIPTKGDNVATEMETLAAWLHVLGNAMSDKPLPWLLEVVTQMRRVRKQLEQEGRTPEWELDSALSFVRDYLQEPEEQWQNTIRYEKERWETLRTTFNGVDEQLALWQRRSAEQCRAAEMENPHPRGMIIVACVPELSPINRLYLRRMAESGAARVEIWVNAPSDESLRFDDFGQPIPTIAEGPFAGMGWSECPIIIPHQGTDNHLCAEDVIHPTGSVQAYGRKVRELAGGHHADELVLASCDDSLSPMIVTAFQPEWQINMPEGRSLLATEAGRIPLQLKEACASLYQNDISDSRAMEDLQVLLRNRILQCCMAPPQSLVSYNRYLTELCSVHLPGSAKHLLHLMRQELQQMESREDARPPIVQKLRHYLHYTENIIDLLNDCNNADTLPTRLCELADALARRLTAPEMKRAARVLTELLRDAAALVTDRTIACPPQTALMLVAHLAEKKAAGILEGAGERNKSINLKGWRELCYTSEPYVIIAGMHDNCVPERMPADAYLPNAYRAFQRMTNDTTRCARDSFLLTALLHSRAAGNIHFVLSACTTDGTPIAPSSLLLRCNSAAETAQRVHWLFSDPQVNTTEQAYDLLPFITPPQDRANDGMWEDISLIAPGITNPYAASERTFSPSAIKSFLSCPLRFWLNKLLNICPGDALEENKAEPDHAEYGTLLHAILQDITTRYPRAEAGTNEETLADEIAEYAIASTTAHVAKQYGDADDTLTLPIRILQNNLYKTTCAFAKKHAQDLCNGWEVLMTEEQLVFSMPASDNSAPLIFDMRVDRVDRHRDDGRMRVIDYKSNATDPRKTHWEKLSETAAQLHKIHLPAEFTLQDDNGDLYRWNSVQLPLYAEALRRIHHLNTLPETAFYNMPRSAPAEVTYNPMCGLKAKSAMTQELHEQAMRCVQAAAHLMRAGMCLASAESLGRSLKYNNFGALNIYKDPDPRVMCSLPTPDNTTSSEI